MSKLKNLANFIGRKIPNCSDIRYNESKLIWDHFRIQIYHDKFEVYFCNSFFGALNEADTKILLILYAKGNEK